jgi:anti-sigma regulatory factor (Ser/Thr protein kinase)
MTAHPVRSAGTAARLDCRAVMANLPALLTLVDNACQREQADAETAHALKLITEEACVNVMHHAYPPGQPGPLTLQVRAVTHEGQRYLQLRLQDLGTPFDPLSLAPAAVTACAQARMPGGLGVHLIRQLSDRQHYVRDARQGNVFTIEKRLAPARSP